MTEHTHDGDTHHGGPRAGGLNLHEDADNAVDMWDGMYRERPKVWSGKPNPQLVAETAGLKPEAALDLGCGEGADAIWLAQQGWRVTAVDVSAVALERAAAHAAEPGVQEQIAFEQQDLASWRPDAQFDLVSSQYLHSPLLDWRATAAMAAGAVAPGGTLLLVGHYPHGRHAGREMLYTEKQLADALDSVLASGQWTVHVLEIRERTVTGPDGEAMPLIDTVLRASREP
jgi:SAM-dependent methyltransferase